MSNERFGQQEARFVEKLQAIDHAYEEYAKSKGLTYMSLEILEDIVESSDGCTQKEICELTHYPKQSVNLIIKGFWESGYVELCEIKSDRRNKKIILTEAGKSYANEMVTPLWEADEKATLALSDKEREELIRLMGIYEKTFIAEIEG